MFFPAKEFPTEALEEALAEAGVVCRPLPDLDLPPSNATDMETDLSGFTMKVAALLLSRFQEVTPMRSREACYSLVIMGSSGANLCQASWPGDSWLQFHTCLAS